MDQLFLTLSNPLFIVGLLIFFSLWIKPDLIFQAAFVLAFSILLNVALKITFRISLLPTVGHAGFAFPSGHTQLSTVFYLWSTLIFYKRWPLLLFSLFIIFGIGWALITNGFHTFQDVIAGFLTGVLLVLTLSFAYKKWPRNTSPALLALACFITLYIFFRQGVEPIHAYIAFGWMLFDRFFNTLQNRLFCWFKKS